MTAAGRPFKRPRDVYKRQLLHQVAEDNPYIETVRRLIPILERFAPLAAEDVPKETLLREFLGGGLY